MPSFHDSILKLNYPVNPTFEGLPIFFQGNLHTFTFDKQTIHVLENKYHDHMEAVVIMYNVKR